MNKKYILSNFVKKIFLKKDKYAVFNNLLLKPILMNKKEVDIFTKNFDCKGVAILVSGIHLCMKIRGVHSNTNNKTIAMTGIFQENKEMRDRFFELINTNRS